mgnify:CR=1 FL=1
MSKRRFNYAVSLNFTMEMDREFNEAHIDPTHEDLVEGLIKVIRATDCPQCMKVIRTIPMEELALETYDIIEVEA